MAKLLKSRASDFKYVSRQKQMILGFETTFPKSSDENNWCIILAKNSHGMVCKRLFKQLNDTDKGAKGVKPHVIIAALMKSICAKKVGCLF